MVHSLQLACGAQVSLHPAKLAKLTVDHQAADLLDRLDCLESVCCHAAETVAAVWSACCGRPWTVPCPAQLVCLQAACKAKAMTFVCSN